jgi:hypothetical protein
MEAKRSLSRKMLLIVATMSVSFSSISVAQPEQVRISYGITASANKSFYRPTTSSDYSIICDEVKVGLSFRKQFYSFGLNAGLSPGWRFEQKLATPVISEPNPSSQTFQEYFFLAAFTKAYALGRLYVEVPLTIDYSLANKKIEIHVGALYRSFDTKFTDGLNHSYLKELGALLKLKCNITEVGAISVDYFKSMSRFNQSTYVHNATNYSVDGSFIQFSTYLLFRKR